MRQNTQLTNAKKNIIEHHNIVTKCRKTNNVKHQNTSTKQQSTSKQRTNSMQQRDLYEYKKQCKHDTHIIAYIKNNECKKNNTNVNTDNLI